MSWEIISISFSVLSSQIGCCAAVSNHVGRGCNAAWLHNRKPSISRLIWCFTILASLMSFPKDPQIFDDIKIRWSFHGTLLTFFQAPQPKERDSEKERERHTKRDRDSWTVQGTSSLFSMCFRHIFWVSALWPALHFYSCYSIPQGPKMGQTVLTVFDMKRLGLTD